MAGYRKLGRTSDQRRALIKSQVAALLYHGHIRITETRARETRKVAEGLIAMAVKEKDNYEIVKVIARVVRKDKDGKGIKEVADGEKAAAYDEAEKKIKKDIPPRLYTRRQMLKVLCGATEAPSIPVDKKKNIKSVDMVARLFDDIAPEYTSRNGDCTRIAKAGPRKGDATMEVLIELV